MFRRRQVIMSWKNPAAMWWIRWCVQPDCLIRLSKCGQWRHRLMIFFRRFVSERQLTNAYWSPHSPSGWRKISPNISKNMASACVIFTRISTPSNVWRLSATCVWVSSTCWWGSTYCAKVWICRRFRWWRSSTLTKKASCVPNVR